MGRSRTGCTTCKKRHRKCDETKPSCLKCQDNGLTCEGYAIKLQWDVGVASRGRLTGATVPVLAPEDRNKPGSRDDQYMIGGEHGAFGQFQASPIGTTDMSCDAMEEGEPRLDDFEVHETDTLDFGRTTSSSYQEPLWLQRRSDGEKKLFEGFVEQTVYLLYSTSIHDTFKTQLKRLAYQTEALYYTLIATHLYTTNPSNPPPLFHEFYNRSLRIFREQLNSFNGILDAGLINAGVFLCTLHLFQGIPWTNHLNHMMWVYGLFPGAENASRIADVEFRFPIEAMAVMDMPTFVRGRKTSTLGIWAHMRSAQASTSSGLLNGVESISGLPRSLLDIFARVQDTSAEEAFTNWPGYAGSVPHCHLWEAFRLSGILINRRLNRNRSQSNSPSTEVLVCRLVATLDALYETHHRLEYRHILAKNSILYPYTAARLEVAVLQTTPSWIDALRRYEGLCDPYRETPNAIVLEEILDRALERGDNEVDLDKLAQQQGVEISLF